MSDNVHGSFVFGGGKGLPGDKGDPGSLWRSGFGAPSNGLGIDKDFYFDRSNGTIYEKVDGAYQTRGTFQGPAGPQGPRGIAGLTQPYVIASTLAELNGLLNYNPNVGGEVGADPTPANRGIYKKVGAYGTGSWTKIRDLYPDFIWQTPSDFDGIRITDKYGFIPRLSVNVLRGGELTWPGFRIEATDTGVVRFLDKNNFVIPILGATGGGDNSGVGAIDITSFDFILAANADAMAHRALVIANGPIDLAGLFWSYSWICELGQSLSDGGNATRNTPAGTLNTTNVMVGNAVQPKGVDNYAEPPVNTTFNQFGSLAFTPIKATVIKDNHDDFLSDPEIAGLVSDTAGGYQGETASITTSIVLKLLTDKHRGMLLDTNKSFVVTSTGRGGMNIDYLSDTNGPIWKRTVDVAGKINTLATGLSKTSGIAVFMWQQGETNDVPLSTFDYYLAKLELIRTQIVTTLMPAFGQRERPIFILNQTGKNSWQNDYPPGGYGMAHSRAQLAFSLMHPDVALVGPNYYVTARKNQDHPDDNGQRWFGCQNAKVLHRMLNLGQGWEPLRPYRAFGQEIYVLITFHVPVPPVQFDDPYESYTKLVLKNKGIIIKDVGGVIDFVKEPEIVAPCTILVTLTRRRVGASTVWIASRGTFTVAGGSVIYDSESNHGFASIKDSDDAVAPLNYEYSPSNGDQVEANLVDLVGKPYPLNNWVVADIIDIEEL